MSQIKKKIFPSAKKSLKKFLTDEKGRITKKDALGITAAAALIAWVEDVVAGHGNTYPTSTTPSWADPFPSNAEVPNNSSRTNTWTVLNSATCSHASGVVNGHFSNVPAVDINSDRIDYTKSHSNHSSHGSGGWC